MNRLSDRIGFVLLVLSDNEAAISILLYLV